jgi:hypothetical protein
MRAALVTAFAVVLSGEAAAQQIPCGGFHEVRRGETLQRIAVRAYGPDASWRTLWAANRDRLRGDPSLIEVGDMVYVPCPDAGGGASPPLAATGVATGEQTAAEAETEPRPGDEAETSNAVPFASQLLTTEAPGGGRALSALVAEALKRELGENRVSAVAPTAEAVLTATVDVDFDSLEDQSVIVQIVRPGCVSASEPVCEGLAWSRPLREIVATILTRAATAEEGPTAARAVCLQSGLPPSLLDEAGFSPDARVREGSAKECVLSVASGASDWAVVEASAGEAETARAGLGAALVEHTGLARGATLHAAARADSEAGRATIAALDAALARMEESGRMAAVTRAALAADALTR